MTNKCKCCSYINNFLHIELSFYACLISILEYCRELKIFSLLVFFCNCLLLFAIFTPEVILFCCMYLCSSSKSYSFCMLYNTHLPQPICYRCLNILNSMYKLFFFLWNESFWRLATIIFNLCVHFRLRKQQRKAVVTTVPAMHPLAVPGASHSHRRMDSMIQSPGWPMGHRTHQHRSVLHQLLSFCL